MANFIDSVISTKVDLLLAFIGTLDLNEDDFELIDKVIVKQETIENIKAKKITTFSYPQKAYSIKPNEDVSIKPECDGTKVTYSITPNLPEGLIFNKDTGEISGKVLKEIEQEKYEIVCKNVFGKLQTTVKIEVFEYKFRSDCTGSGMSIQNNYLQAYKTTNGDWNGHAYVNAEMKKGIYRIKYKFGGNNNNNHSYMGATPNKNYNSGNLYNQSNTNSFYVYTNTSSCNCKCGSIVNQPEIKNHANGSEYELIFDMDKKEFSVVHDGKETLLMKDIPSVLYPYVEMCYSSTYFDLISVVHE